MWCGLGSLVHAAVRLHPRLHSLNVDLLFSTAGVNGPPVCVFLFLFPSPPPDLAFLQGGLHGCIVFWVNCRKFCSNQWFLNRRAGWGGAHRALDKALGRERAHPSSPPHLLPVLLASTAVAGWIFEPKKCSFRSPNASLWR